MLKRAFSKIFNTEEPFDLESFIAVNGADEVILFNSPETCHLKIPIDIYNEVESMNSGTKRFRRLMKHFFNIRQLSEYNLTYLKNNHNEILTACFSNKLN